MPWPVNNFLRAVAREHPVAREAERELTELVVLSQAASAGSAAVRASAEDTQRQRWSAKRNGRIVVVPRNVDGARPLKSI